MRPSVRPPGPPAGLLSVLAVAAALAACATPPPRDAETGADAADSREAVVDTPPVPRDDRSTGYLSWERLGVRMVGEGPTAGLRLDVTTLDDEAIALASDDIRAYLRDVKGRITDAVPTLDARELHAFLVGYTGFEKEVSFDPTLLELRSEGSTYYPRYIVPVSPQFDRRLVNLHETVYGIYLFDSEIDLNAILEFRYENLSSGSGWRSVVEAIQRAKTRGGRSR
ncbi:MAG: hypothetical protein KY397_02415 [Gemmatimonadetes bacterium]|nr:hypothetical protein [Gemmatimonadota bacterium]